MFCDQDVRMIRGMKLCSWVSMAAKKEDLLYIYIFIVHLHLKTHEDKETTASETWDVYFSSSVI